jgi:quercetin dioxygenase-like cupin family protein
MTSIGGYMKVRTRFVGLAALFIMFQFTSMFLSASEDKEKKVPEPKLIVLDPSAKGYVRILGGPPETVTMHSGLVVLAPGKSVGKHNTENYEEVLVVLEGSGEMTMAGGPTLQLKAGSVAYCPPRTEHNVVCTGSANLKYVYVVANAE